MHAMCSCTYSYHTFHQRNVPVSFPTYGFKFDVITMLHVCTYSACMHLLSVIHYVHLHIGIAFCVSGLLKGLLHEVEPF